MLINLAKVPPEEMIKQGFALKFDPELREVNGWVNEIELSDGRKFTIVRVFGSAQNMEHAKYAPLTQKWCSCMLEPTFHNTGTPRGIPA